MRNDRSGCVPHEGEEEDSGYESLFLRFSDHMEKRLIRAALGLAALLLLIQLLLLVPAVRHLLVRVERLEGVPFQEYRLKNG